MSITASVTGLIVMAARKIKAVPRRFSVFLWLIPFVRMWVPFGMNSRYSLMTLISQLTTKTVTIYQPADDIAFSVTNTLMLADSYFPIAYKVNILSKVFEISSLVWIISALALILALTILYSTTKHEIRDAVHLKGNVFLSPKVESPAVYGLSGRASFCRRRLRQRSSNISCNMKKHIFADWIISGDWQAF